MHLMDDPLIGYQIANFRIMQLLGRGGMASVYYGWDVQLERPVAIKIIDARFRDQPGYAGRFLHEARQMATWRHPNIPQVFYAGDDNGLYYYVMEYIHGLDLSKILSQYAGAGQLMPLEDILRVARAVASALDYAHAHGVIHRDVKPSNVMVAKDGRVALTDFGLALNIEQGTQGEVFGSPRYIAPEQALNSANAVAQSDLYSLGIMLYQMLTGAVPFDDEAPTALAFQHINTPPPSPRQFNPNLNEDVEAVLLQALSKKPSERQTTALALVDALGAALAIAPPPTNSTLPHSTAARPAPQSGSAAKPVLSLTLAEQVTIGTASQPPLPTPPPSQPVGNAPVPLRPSAGYGIGCALLALIALIVVVASNLISLTNRPEQTAGGFDWSKWTPRVANLGTPNPGATQADADQPQAPGTPAPPAEAPTGSRRFAMYYDDTGFYLKNLSGKQVNVNAFAFERLNANGEPILRVEGSYWGQIYNRFRADTCMVTEIAPRTVHLKPPECEGQRLVVRTPSDEQPYVFWTTLEGSPEFRVLWDGAEVGRCATGAGTCEVSIP